MKKWCMLVFLLLLLPAGAFAEGLDDLLGAVSQGFGEGIDAGLEALAQDMTLTLTAQDTRIEEGRTLLLTVTAGNPYPAEMPVDLTLDLPARLACAQPLTWSATLPAAKTDPQTGETVPSQTAFTREVALTPGGGSEQAALRAELNMGARFYRAETALDLCVPQIGASADIPDGAGGHVVPGETYAYEISVRNDGTAPKDVPVVLTLPAGVTADALPAGFVRMGQTIRGAVRAQVGAVQTLRMPVTVRADALSGDDDASLLLAGHLTVDGENVALPAMRAVGPLIRAKLTPADERLETGSVTELTVTLVNAGLAGAAVDVSCRLPDGLTLVGVAQEDEEEAPVSVLPEGGEPPAADAQTVMSDAADVPAVTQEGGALRFSLQMDGATETEAGVVAATKEITLRLRADAQRDSLLGASLAWTTDGGETQLGEAAALTVRGPGFLGMSDTEWNGILLAALLMMVTIVCLCGAVRSENKPQEYCFE